MIEKINYDQKNWNENDVVTDADLNRIESGINNVTQYTNALNDDTNLRLTQLGSDLSNAEDRLRTEMDNSDASIAAELAELKKTVVADKQELLKKIDDVKNDVVLQSNFESTLKTGIAPLLVTDSTTYLSINGGSLTLEKKNTSKSVIKYAYYKRTSTASVNIVQSVSFPSERYSMWKHKTFTLATLGDGTSNMTEEDLSRFGGLIRNSGTGSTNISFYIQEGKLMAKVGLLGGGLISVNFEGKIYFNSANDKNYISY
ncbi:MAG: hypothetical protein K2K85_01300 [Clostridia bacterium]|nr:hypothetical protein [Clostridia bacterium]